LLDRKIALGDIAAHIPQRRQALSIFDPFRDKHVSRGAARENSGIYLSVNGAVWSEEFAVVLPETGLNQALLVCRTLREEIFKVPFCSGSLQMAVTASFGVAAIETVPRKPKKLAERLLSAADRALYRSKAAGRDQVAAVRLKFGHR
jgi:predicted signal transduction protein with EAL and GGDEF domain